MGTIGKVGFSKAMSNGWITLDKGRPEGPMVVRKVDSIKDEVKDLLAEIATGKDYTESYEKYQSINWIEMLDFTNRLSLVLESTDTK